MLFPFFFFLFWSSKLQEFEYKFFPEITPHTPLCRRYWEIVPLKIHQNNTNIRIDFLETEDISSTIRFTKWVKYLSPFADTYDVHKGSHWIAEHAEPVKITLWNNDRSQIIEDSSRVSLIYWDFRLFDCHYTFSQQNLGPGEAFIHPVPQGETSFVHQRCLTHVEYQRQTADGSADSRFGSCDRIDIHDHEYYHAKFSTPSIRYVGVTFHSGTEGYWPGHAMPCDNEHFFALIVCNWDGTCPTIDPAWNNKGPVFYLPPIPRNRQLPARKTDIGIVEGFSVYMERNLIDFDFVDVSLPWGILIDTYRGFYTIIDQPSEHFFMYQYRIDITYDAGPTFPIAFKFEKGIWYDYKYTIYLRIEGGEWQRFYVTPRDLKHIESIPSFWDMGFPYDSTLNNFKSIEFYRSFGYNGVSSDGYSRRPLTQFSNVTPESRQSWPSDMHLSTGEVLFYRDNPSLYLYDMIYDVLNANTRTDSWVNPSITGTQRTEELRLWQNAIDFHTSTGLLDYPCYRGYFHQQQLKIFGDWLNYTRPKMINLNIENLEDMDDIVDNFNKSVNCEERRVGQETDLEAYTRISNEWLSDIVNTVNNNSPGTKVMWFSLDCHSNIEYQMALWEDYERHNIICQPMFYRMQKIYELGATFIRNSKKNIGKDALLIPCGSHRCWGTFTTEILFDSLVQSYTNGATGYQFFAISHVDDHDFFYYTNEFVRMFAPYNDFVEFGEIAFHDVSEVQNLVLGVLKYQNKYLIGVSPMRGYKSIGNGGYFRIPYGVTYEIINIRTGARHFKSYYDILKNEIVVFWTRTPNTAVLLIQPNEGRFFSSIAVFSILLITVSLVFLCVFLIICFLGFFFKGKVSKKDVKE